MFGAKFLLFVQHVLSFIYSNLVLLILCVLQKVVHSGPVWSIFGVCFFFGVCLCQIFTCRGWIFDFFHVLI